MTRARRLVGPVSLVVVLGVALLVGSGAFGRGAPARAARIAGIERLVAAPPHSDLSVAVSDSPASRAVRNQIAAEVSAGWSDDRILDGIEAHWGTQILLEPPGGGLDDVLWVVPIVLAVGAVTVLATVVVRRRRAIT